VFTGNGLRFVRHDRELIEGGDYLFGYSHLSAHELTLPPDTFTVTILRDPIARVESYFRHLAWARANPLAREREPSIDQLRVESRVGDGPGRRLIWRFPPRNRGGRLRNTLWQRLPGREHMTVDRFLRQVEPDRLMSQLFMFSSRLDPEEAAENILSCSSVCFTETFSADLRRLARTLDLDLVESREREFKHPVHFSSVERERLRECLAKEYAMLSLVQNGRPRH
jgi:hypothetical protein